MVGMHTDQPGSDTTAMAIYPLDGQHGRDRMGWDGLGWDGMGCVICSPTTHARFLVAMTAVPDEQHDRRMVTRVQCPDRVSPVWTLSSLVSLFLATRSAETLGQTE